MPRILAPKTFAPGDIVYDEKPYVRVLMRKYKDKLCEYCHKGTPIHSCLDCKAVKYCSNDCKSSDKGDHKFECKHLRTLPLKHEDFVRLLGRVILKIQGDEKYRITKCKLGIDSSFYQLKGKAEEVRESDQRTLCSKEIYLLLKIYMRHNIPHEDEVVDVIKKVMFNTMLSVVDDEFVGLYLYLGITKLAQECIPNTNMGIYDGDLKITALKVIQKKELITIPSRKNYSIKAVPLERKSYPCKCTDCSLPYQESVLRSVLEESSAYSVIKETKLLFHAIRSAEYLKIYPPRNEIDKMLEKQKNVLGCKHALYMRLLTIKCFRIPVKRDEAEKLFEELTKITSMVYGGQILGLGRDLFYCQYRLI